MDSAVVVRSSYCFVDIMNNLILLIIFFFKLFSKIAQMDNILNYKFKNIYIYVWLLSNSIKKEKKICYYGLHKKNCFKSRKKNVGRLIIGVN